MNTISNSMVNYGIQGVLKNYSLSIVQHNELQSNLSQPSFQQFQQIPSDQQMKMKSVLKNNFTVSNYDLINQKDFSSNQISKVIHNSIGDNQNKAIIFNNSKQQNYIEQKLIPSKSNQTFIVYDYQGKQNHDNQQIQKKTQQLQRSNKSNKYDNDFNKLVENETHSRKLKIKLLRSGFINDIVAPNEADYVKPNQTTPLSNNTKNKTKNNNTINSNNNTVNNTNKTVPQSNQTNVTNNTSQNSTKPNNPGSVIIIPVFPNSDPTKSSNSDPNNPDDTELQDYTPPVAVIQNQEIPQGLSKGALAAAIVVPIIAFFIIAGVIVYCCWIKKSQSGEENPPRSGSQKPMIKEIKHEANDKSKNQKNKQGPVEDTRRTLDSERKLMTPDEESPPKQESSKKGIEISKLAPEVIKNDSDSVKKVVHSQNKTKDIDPQSVQKDHPFYENYEQIQVKVPSLVHYNQQRQSIDTVRRQTISTSPIKFECQAVDEKKADDTVLDESPRKSIELSEEDNGSTIEAPIASMAQVQAGKLEVLATHKLQFVNSDKKQKSLENLNFETDEGVDFSDDLEDQIAGEEKRQDFKSPEKNQEPVQMLNFDKK